MIKFQEQQDRAMGEETKLMGGIYDPDPAGGAHMKIWSSMHVVQEFWAMHPAVARVEAVFHEGKEAGDQGYEISLWLTEEGWNKYLVAGYDKDWNAVHHSEATTANATRDLYASSNGDRWQLVRDDGGRVYVVHQANLASGGRRSEIHLAAFLAEGHGPQHQELLRLIGTLVDRGRSDIAQLGE